MLQNNRDNVILILKKRYAYFVCLWLYDNNSPTKKHIWWTRNNLLILNTFGSERES